MKDYKVDKESFSESFRKEVYEVVSRYLWEKYLLMEVLLCCWGHPNARGWWDVH